jgi:serine/threonine-protein kinase
VAAAAAVVPAIALGVAGLAAADGFTQLLGTQGTGTATQLMPAADAVAVEETTEKKKRSPWTWPLIALIALLLIVLIGTIWALLANNGNAAAPVTSKTQSSSPTPSPTPTPATVDIASLGLVGKKCGDAMTAASQAGLVPTLDPKSATPSTSSQPGTVASTNPTGGNADKGSSITITCYGQLPDIPGPSSAPQLTQNGQVVAAVVAGSTVTVNWAAFTCPSGTGTLSGYTLTVTGGTLPNGTQTANFDPGTRTAQMTVANQPGGTVTASYIGLCSGSAGQRESQSSPKVQASITAPPTTPPTPTPTP